MDEHNSHSAPEPKGKGKQTSSTSSPAPDQRQQQARDACVDRSFADRVVSSASNLSRAAMSGRPEGFRSGAPGKAQSEHTSGPGLAHQSQTATYHGRHGEGSSAGAAFSHSGHSATAGEGEYNDFMASQADPALAGQFTLQVSRPVSGRSAVNEQEGLDGRQVVDLLNLPDELDGFGDGSDNLEPLLSPRAESALREALFGTCGKRAALDWATLLDFLPEFLQGGNHFEIQQHFGDVDPQRAMALWMDSWDEVLTSYTDEVWGGLGSLAREAQKEVEGARGREPGQATGDMKALQRLRLILAHVRGPGTG